MLSHNRPGLRRNICDLRTCADHWDASGTLWHDIPVYRRDNLHNVGTMNASYRSRVRRPSGLFDHMKLLADMLSN
jgi:hypothetical protein